MKRLYLVVGLLSAVTLTYAAEWDEDTTDPQPTDTLMFNDLSKDEGDRKSYTAFSRLPVSTPTQTELDDKVDTADLVEVDDYIDTFLTTGVLDTPEMMSFATYTTTGTASRAVTDRECFSGTIVVTANADFDLDCTPALGKAITFVSDGAWEIGVDPPSGVCIMKNGVCGTAGAMLSSAGTVDDKIELVAISSTVWRAKHVGTWAE